MKKWKYKKLSSKNHYVGLSEPDLNRLGGDGWELISVTGDEYKVYIFKKEVI